MTDLAEQVFSRPAAVPRHERRSDVPAALTPSPATGTVEQAFEFEHRIGHWRLLEKVSGFALLQDDWDGQGAEPIARSAVASAMEFLRTLEVDWLPWVAPTTDGGVRVEWDGEQSFLVLNFRQGNHAELFFRLPGQDVRAMKDDGIPDDLSWFYAAVRRTFVPLT